MNRRKFMAGAVALGAAALGADRLANMALPGRQVNAATTAKLVVAEKLTTIPSKYSAHGLTETSFQDITSYNNFYEFGTGKSDPSHNAWRLKTRPWTVKVTGLVNKKQTFDIDALLKLRPMEERIYRFRCVEAWSMVIPWAEYSLSEFIKQCDPLSSARYVQFLSLDNPGEEPEMRSVNLHWPYSEGLRMDEAINPLTLLTFDLYGQALDAAAPVDLPGCDRRRYPLPVDCEAWRADAVESDDSASCDAARAHRMEFAADGKKSGKSRSRLN